MVLVATAALKAGLQDQIVVKDIDAPGYRRGHFFCCSQGNTDFAKFLPLPHAFSPQLYLLHRQAQMEVLFPHGRS